MVGNQFKEISLSIFSVFIFLFAKGFIFNSADQVEPLVLVYKNLYPHLFQGDFYVEAAKYIFTVRYYYIHLLTFLGGYFPLYEISIGLTVLCLFFTALGLIKIVGVLTSAQMQGVFAPFFVLFLFLEWTVGGNVLQYNLLIGSSLAKAASVWAIYFLLNRKYIVSGLMVGLGGLFQVLVGLQMGLIVLTFMLIYRNWRGIFKWGTSWFIAISPILIPILYRQTTMQVSETDESFFYLILYQFRNPEHYLPSLFPINSYIKILLLMMIGNFSLFLMIDRQLFYKVQVVNAIIVFGLIFYSISLELFSWLAIGKIQWFKTTIALNVIGALGLAIGLEYLFKYILKFKFLNLWGMIAITLWAFIFHSDSLLKGMDKRNDQQKELSVLHQWIYLHTPINALFATYIDDESFMCEAKRPLTLSWNCMIHEPWFLVEWYHRFYQQYHVKTSIYQHIEVKKQANQYYENGEWLDNTKAQYCIVRKEVVLARTKEIFSSANYKVLKIN
ncbi:MAG: hypothetical protein LC105_11060 [Chitinophagales bacterium]|nr:hypothetical protein [Chitinophagales bacterium]MCZ2394389.1 hypothetical protein [Chitinophagales bacterium]